MRKKLQSILTGVITVTMLAVLSGCGSTAAPAEPAEETIEEQEVFPEPDLAEYKSSDGWSVRYDPAVIEVEEGDSTVSFLYAGEADSDSMNQVTIRYEADRQPEELLDEITSAWDAPEDVIRSEGFFPGTDDMWGYWRLLFSEDGSAGLSRTAIAGEYNGGVLLLQNTQDMTGDDAVDMAVIGALETVVDSITYEDFQPQTMYDSIPGVYTAEQDGAVNSITLKENHTGVLCFQDDVSILWGSVELMAADGSFTYEYSIEGNSLYLNYDGQWIEFVK